MVRTANDRRERHGGRPLAALRRVDTVLRLFSYCGSRTDSGLPVLGLKASVVDPMDRLGRGHAACLAAGVGEDHYGDAERQGGDRRDREQRSHEVVLGSEDEAGVLSGNVLLQNFHVHWPPP
jgi:hypothetical protein